MKGSRDKGRKSSRREILQFEICNPRFVIRRRRWEVPMKQTSNLLLTLVFVLAGVTLALSETTLEKIARTGTLAIGTRTGSPPFAYVDKQNEWVGFSIDLVEQLILPSVAKKAGKPVKLEKKESTPPTRIPLLTSNAVDMIAETMTDTTNPRQSID